MFVIFMIGLVLTVCAMRTGADDCKRCCERIEIELFKSAIVLHKNIGSHTTVKKVQIKRLTHFKAKRTNIWLREKMSLDSDIVNTDAGNNFKPEVGIFKDPVKDIYFVYLEATSQKMFELGIFHNVWEVGKVDTNLHSTTVIIELAEKDMVYVKVNVA